MAALSHWFLILQSVIVNDKNADYVFKITWIDKLDEGFVVFWKCKIISRTLDIFILVGRKI